MSTTWDESTAVRRLSDHTYEANLRDDWCNGTVPHGGYVTSCLMRVATAHFQETLGLDQRHTMTMHVEFLRKTETGPARIVVEDVKLGRYSTIRITLSQHNAEQVMAHITQTNFDLEEGPSRPTDWSLQPRPYDVDLVRLKIGEDPNWVETTPPFGQFRKVNKTVRLFNSRKDRVISGMHDQWICFREGAGSSRFTGEALGFVADMFPGLEGGLQPEPGKIYWCPTVVLNLEVKKALPAEGLEWLFVRATIKQLKNGRMDVEVIVMDAEMELVAISHHVALVVDASRNIAARSIDAEREKM